MEEKVVISEKEDILLLLKWGENYELDLYYVWVAGARGLTELEVRAAKIGKQLRIKIDEEVTKAMAEEIRTELDEQLLKKITGIANERK